MLCHLSLKVNISLDGYDCVKSDGPKHLVKIFFDRRRSPDEVKILIKNQCEMFKIGDVCSCVCGLWLTTTGI